MSGLRSLEAFPSCYFISYYVLKFFILFRDGVPNIKYLKSETDGTEK